MPISAYSTTPASNNSAPPNGAPEGMAPSSLNDTIRQIMADIKTWYDTMTATANFTGTLTGVSGTVTGTLNYLLVGDLVVLTVPAISGTSNSSGMSITGLPAGIQPVDAKNFPVAFMTDNTASVNGSRGISAQINAGTITYFIDGGNLWTSSGTKGVHRHQLVYNKAV